MKKFLCLITILFSLISGNVLSGLSACTNTNPFLGDSFFYSLLPSSGVQTSTLFKDSKKDISKSFLAQNLFHMACAFFKNFIFPNKSLVFPLPVRTDEKKRESIFMTILTNGTASTLNKGERPLWTPIG